MNSPKKKPLQKKKMFSLMQKIALIVVGVILLGAGLITGYLQFGIATVVCLKPPVAATTFAAAYSYELPGEPLYGPSPFNQYYCNERDAKNAGFRHSVLTPAGEKEQQQETNQLDGVTADTSDFAVYSPTSIPTGFTKEDPQTLHIHGEPQVQWKLQSGSSEVGRLLQGKQTPVSMHYWVCFGAGTACRVIATDSSGRQVYKYERKGVQLTLWGVLLDNKTYFQIEGEDKAGMTDQEAIQILGSLAPTTENSGKY